MFDAVKKLINNIKDKRDAKKAAKTVATSRSTAPAYKPYTPPVSMPEYDPEDDDIVTLTTANGEEVDFVEIAGIAYGGKFYAILQPVELLDGMDDDEALVFRVSRGRDGEDKFDIETDDYIIERVFEEYNRLLDEQLNS
jgi:uncharacterized protein YrzB (UPF0473 family)